MDNKTKKSTFRIRQHELFYQNLSDQASHFEEGLCRADTL